MPSRVEDLVVVIEMKNEFSFIWSKLLLKILAQRNETNSISKKPSHLSDMLNIKASCK